MPNITGEVEVKIIDPSIMHWEEDVIVPAELVEPTTDAQSTKEPEQPMQPEVKPVSDPILKSKVESIERAVSTRLIVTEEHLGETMGLYRRAETIAIDAIKDQAVQREKDAKAIANRHIQPLIEAKERFNEYKTIGERLLTEVHEVQGAIRALDITLPVDKELVKSLRKDLAIRRITFEAFMIHDAAQNTEASKQTMKQSQELIVGEVTPVKSIDDPYEEVDTSETEASTYLDERLEKVRTEAHAIRENLNNITAIYNKNREKRDQSMKELDELRLRIDDYLSEVEGYMSQFSDLEEDRRHQMEEEIANRQLTPADIAVEAAVSLLKNGEITGIEIDDDMVEYLNAAATRHAQRSGHEYKHESAPLYGGAQSSTKESAVQDGPVVSSAVDSVARMLTEKVEVAESIAGVVVSRSRVAFDAAKRLLLSDAASNGRHAKKTPGTALVTQSIGMLPRRDPEELPGEDPVLWGAGPNIEQPAWRTVK